jgi:sugar phosphate isomerase/epimerase
VYGETAPDGPARLALQLYTVRDDAAADLDAVLERAAGLGFLGVEPAGLHGFGAQRFRARCAALGLAIPAAHAELPADAESARAVLGEVAELGAPALVIPLLPPDTFARRDAILRAAAWVAAMGELARGFGLALGYHNHDWEFAARLGSDTAHAVFFAALPAEVFAEVDVYWARVGGCDPAAELRRLGTRARLLHVKDGPARDDQAPMTAVGDGALDVPGILAASSAEWHIVEIDHCRGDVWQALERSCAYLAGRGLARSR